jgi:serine/threonine protein kinase
LHLSAVIGQAIKFGRNLRGIEIPFAPPAMTKITGSTAGVMALPSWSHQGLYYPAIFMQAANCTFLKESAGLAKLLNDKDGKVSDHVMPRVASALLLILEPLHALHKAGLSHKDIKEDNILLFEVRPGSERLPGHKHWGVDGKFYTARFGDFGKSSFPDVPYVSPSKFEAFDPKALQALSPPAAPPLGSTRAVNALKRATAPGPVEPIKTTTSRTVVTASSRLGGTVPVEIPLRDIHLQTGCAPSCAQPGDPPTPKNRISGYGSDHYSPPEHQPQGFDSESAGSAPSYLVGRDW